MLYCVKNGYKKNFDNKITYQLYVYNYIYNLYLYTSIFQSISDSKVTYKPKVYKENFLKIKIENQYVCERCINKTGKKTCGFYKLYGIAHFNLLITIYY